MLAKIDSMEISQILKQTPTGALYEDEAKIVLKQVGIPVVPEKRIPINDTALLDAVTGAAELGFPHNALVVKGLGKNWLNRQNVLPSTAVVPCCIWILSIFRHQNSMRSWALNAGGYWGLFRMDTSDFITGSLLAANQLPVHGDIRRKKSKPK